MTRKDGQIVTPHLCPICGGYVRVRHNPDRALCQKCHKQWEYLVVQQSRGRREVYAGDGEQTYLLGNVSARRPGG